MIKQIPLTVSLGELTDVSSLYASVRSQMNMGIAYMNYPFTRLFAPEIFNDVLQVVDEGDLLEIESLRGIPAQELELPNMGLALGGLMAIQFFNQDGIRMMLPYVPSRYSKATMERFCAEYQRIAKALVNSKLTASLKGLLAE